MAAHDLFLHLADKAIVSHSLRYRTAHLQNCHHFFGGTVRISKILFAATVFAIPNSAASLNSTL
jgi:hypothetical protein